MSVNHDLMRQLIDRLIDDQRINGDTGGLNKLGADLVDAIKMHMETRSSQAESNVYAARRAMAKALAEQGDKVSVETVKSFVDAIKNGYYIWDESPEEGGKSPRLRLATEEEQAAFKQRITGGLSSGVVTR
ncbi:MAG: hypothetical protein ACOYJ2_04315 [Rickettsiales bacterium]